MIERFVFFLKDLAIPKDYDGSSELFKMYKLVKTGRIDINNVRANFDASHDDEMLIGFLKGEVDEAYLERNKKDASKS